MKKKGSFQLLAKIVLLVLAVVATGVYFKVFRNSAASIKDVHIHGIVLPTPKPILDFSLTDTNNAAFSKANFRNHWTFLFFGFTNCGMVCPTTMASLKNMYHLLEKELPASEMPQVIMVTVDPKRDTEARLKEYLSAFDSRFIGVRGSEGDIAALANQLNIAIAKMEAPGKGSNHYTINHTSEILLVNPKGEVQAYFSFPAKGDELAADYTKLISHANF